MGPQVSRTWKNTTTKKEVCMKRTCEVDMLSLGNLSVDGFRRGDLPRSAF